jgi:precorrin isomerase
MPEGNVFLCEVADAEEIAVKFVVVLAVGFVDRRWSHSGIRRGIVTTTN